jgi:hypothetical protein
MVDFGERSGKSACWVMLRWGAPLYCAQCLNVLSQAFVIFTVAPADMGQPLQLHPLCIRQFWGLCRGFWV